MNDSAHGCLVDSQAKRDSTDQHRHLVRHPALLVTFSHFRLHLSVVRNRRNTVVFEKVHGLLYPVDSGRINDHVVTGISGENLHQKPQLGVLVLTLAHEVIQVGAVEAGDVLVWITQMKLVNNVMAHLARGARGKSSDGALRKM